MTDQQQIEKAAQIIWDRRQGFTHHEIAEALADTGMLTPRCERECEALVEWDELLAERDQALATLQQVRNLIDAHPCTLLSGHIPAHELARGIRAILDEPEDPDDS